jgi:hypothetical protein
VGEKESSMSIPPHQPQSFDKLRARYPKALERVFQYGPKGDQRPVTGPYELENQRFDFEDGLRLIVSRDALGERIDLHVSASIQPGTDLWRQFERRDNFGIVSKMMFKILAEDRWRALSGDKEPLPFNGFTKISAGFKGVPHWRRTE